VSVFSPTPDRVRVGPRRVAHGTLQLVLGRISFLAFGYLVAVILARGLGPVQYGIYGVILSVLVWIEQLGRFGLAETTMKLAPEDEDRRPLIEETAQTLLLAVSVLLFVLCWIAAPALAQIFRISQGAGLFRLAILDVPFTGLYFAYQGILLGRRHFGAVGTGLAVYGLTKLVGISIAALFGLSVTSALVVNILGTAGALLFLATRMSPRPFRLSPLWTWEILHFALPIGLCVLASQVLANFDLWALKILGVERGEIIGMYVAALHIARVPTLSFSAVNGAILPSLSMALARQDMAMTKRYVQGAGRFLLVTLLPASVLVALTAEELMVLLYSGRYSGGAQFLVFQVFTFALFGVALVFNEMLIARGNPYLVAGSALAHIPIAVAANLILIPSQGAIGAATAALFTAV